MRATLVLNGLSKVNFPRVKVLFFQSTFSSNDIKGLLRQNLVNYMKFSNFQFSRPLNSLKKEGSYDVIMTSLPRFRRHHFSFAYFLPSFDKYFVTRTSVI